MLGGDTMNKKQFQKALSAAISHRGASLYDLSSTGPVMVVFLRHAGCTFCREALADLSEQRSQLRAMGVTLCLVHMSEPIEATRLMSKYDLDTVHRFSDPKCKLYRAFGLKRGTLGQLFGLNVWIRGVFSGIFAGHGVGMLQGDGFQMPGVFMLQDGQLLSEFRAETAADRPSYIDIAGAAVGANLTPAADTAVADPQMAGSSRPAQ